MTTKTTAEPDLALANAALLRALVEGDVDVLADAVAPGCRIVGPKGFLIDQQEWIDTHASGIYEQVLLDTVESDVQRYGDTAIRCDLQRSECLYQGEIIAGLFRVMSVWVRDRDAWRLAAIQYTATSEQALDGEDSRREGET
jgi:hypothetical protein